MQAVLQIDGLAPTPLDACAEFFANFLKEVEAQFDGDADQLVILLPAAASDHDDWRRTLARDLGRKYAPKRAIVLGGGSKDARHDMLAYLRGAPGVTGQYLPLHD